MKEFDYCRPTTVEEVCRISGELNEPVKVLAGGTDLLIRMKQKVFKPAKIVSLRDVPGLTTIDYSADEGLTIGAMALLSTIETSKEILNTYPAVAEAAATVGSLQVRNRATIGGNICNAAPSADMLPILIAYDAVALVTNGKTERSVALSDFFIGPGKTVLENGEILISVNLPARSNSSFGMYIKSFRSALDLAVVGVGVVADFQPGQDTCRKLKLVLGAVGPTPISVLKAEKLAEGQKLDDQLIEQIAQLASDESRPISDIRATASYRKSLVAISTRRALEAARVWSQKGGNQ